MSFLKTSITAIAVVLSLGSCDESFDPTAPGVSTPYVICVLNPKDSAQYVRVQRSYICHENAFNFSSHSDSVYYKQDEIEVYLTRFDTLDGSIMDKPIKLYPTDEMPKDSGAFAVNGHYIFKTTAPIHAEFDYELSVVLLKDDRTITSRIQPLGSWNLPEAFSKEQRKTKYSWYHPERIDYFMDLTPNHHPQLTRFLYIEMTSRDTARKYIEYYHNYDELSQLSDDDEEQSFMGGDFLYRFIQKEIPERQGVRRIAVGVDFMISLADSNLVMYQRVEQPDSKTFYTPEFNNIRNGGVGLFASRYKLTLFGKALKPNEVDSVSMGRFTRRLNFADSRGEYHGGE